MYSAAPDPTTLQRLASDPSRSAWVAASAGSGKTKVLTDRVLRLLLTGVSPSRILCITYTKAASAQMQNRLHKRLGAWVLMEEEALCQQLHELSGHAPAKEQVRLARRLFALLLEDTPGLRIQTFHSFCQSLLARFPLEAGVAPHFTLIDEQDAKDLLQEARIRLLQTGLSGADKRLLAAIEELSAASGEWGFTELLTTMIGKRREMERMLAQRGRAVAHNTRVYEALGLPYYGISEAQVIAQVLEVDTALCARIRSVTDILITGTQQDIELANNLQGFLASASVEDLIQALLTTEGQPRKSYMTKKLATLNPQEREFLASTAERCVRLRECLNALTIARLSDAVAILAESLFGLYTTMKRSRGYLDYDDLILKARQLLKGEGMAAWVMYKIDGSIDHLLIDEAQDTSPEQWEMKAALEDEFFSGDSARNAGRTLFVVGDEKQSIYRFQGAAPEGFAKELLRTQEKIHAVKEELVQVPMTTSFRSSPAVLALVDAVFAGEDAHRGLGAEVRHQPNRAEVAGRVELWPLFLWENSAAEGDHWPIPDAQKEGQSPMVQLAVTIAQTIAGWIKQPRLLPGYGRPVRAGDILVLVRNRSDFIGYLSRALKERGVAVAGLDRMKVTEHLAVQDMMALAQFLLLPEDDYTLACLLKSPLYNLSEEALFALCYGRNPRTLWEQLRHYAGQDAACHTVREELLHLLSRADYASPHALFSELLYARGGRKRFMARMGEEVEEVLDMLMELALEYEQLHTPSLQGFLAWLAHGTGDIKRDMDQGMDAVRIMTVHGAKGLEAPIVFLPDTTREHPLRERLYFHEDASAPCVLFSPNKNTDDPLLRGLRAAYSLQEEEELHRLLYVAMTRACDELYIAGYGHKAREVSPHSWYRLVEEGFGRLEGAEERPGGGWQRVQQGIAHAAALPEVTLASVQMLPHYAHQPPAPEATVAALQAASHLDDSEREATVVASPQRLTANQGRGILIHRLLHLLSAVAPDVRLQAARRYLAQHAHTVPPDQHEALAQEVLTVMGHAEFAEVFSPHALAEAPIIGVVEGKRLAGQVDRLLVTEDTVLVVDFKTGAPPENGEIPAPYLHQMHIYQKLLAGVYPRHRIRCALLYTAVPLWVNIA